ncbi:MAG TPA: AEC family transporter [Clostridiales bacterium]|nr:AEC family transporter [Clostridiales bacterium]
MELSIIIEQIFMLFLIAAAGYLGFRTKILNAEGNKAISRLVIYLTLPALILSSVAEVPQDIAKSAVLLLLGASFFTYALLGAVSLAVPRLLRADRSDYGVYHFMTIFGNVGFMGFPVLSALFGEKALFLAAIFNLPMNLFCFSVGILMIAPKGTKLKFTTILNPTVVASVAALLLYLLPLSLPTVLNDGLSLLGSATIPLAMILIGSSLAQLPFREVWNIPKLYLLSLIKLILCPLLIYYVLNLFIDDSLLLGIATVLTAMPVATNATMLCIEYNGNELLASRGVFISTVLSLLTIPLIIFILLS